VALRKPTSWSDGKWRIPTASLLDFKLGFRMLARYPSLSAVAVLAMAFGIAGGAASVEVVKDQAFPPLPYRDADRIVAIQNVNVMTTRPEPRALHHFVTWRKELRSFEMVSALYQRQRNLSLQQESGAPVAEVAISASAFQLLRVAPLLGRGLLAADEVPGAPTVVVIGYELWQTRFRGERDVVGKTVRLGGEQTTVVGVMPKEFAFFVPRESSTLPPPQDLWVPFRLRALDYAPAEGPGITVFGQLAPGATADGARAELATLAARAAADSPTTHGKLKPQILRFARPFHNAEGLAPTAALSLGTLFLATIMVVICGNVALLLFARAATREREIAVRNALGASRARIVAQLFAEALVLAAVAIIVGLVGAAAGLRWVIGVMRSMMEAQGLALPSWIGDTLSPMTIGYAVGLAAIGAVVCGVLPGLKVTGRRSQMTLQRLAGGGSSVRLGGVWTGITVTQVALTVMLVPVGVVFGLQTWKLRAVDHHLPVAQYLAVRLEMDDDADDPTADAAARARFEQSYRALQRRVVSEVGVAGVTVASDLPGSVHDRRRFQLDGLGDLARSGWDNVAQIASVDPNFFDVMRVPIISGRAFHAADVGAEQRVVVVNESFVRDVLGGRNAVGHRLRFRSPAGRQESGPWYTIVGVARDLAMTIDPTVPSNAGIYHLLQPRTSTSMQMAVRVGEPAAFAGRLRELAADVAPALRVRRALPLDQAAQSELITYDATFRLIVLAGALAILLTNAGIYAVISFTVARRTREIGVRVALGADARQIVAVILSRTARHVAVGVLIGAGLGSLLTFGLSEGSFRPTALQGGGLLVAYMGVMMGVCLLACVVPTRRALGIQPTEALAADG
jgi:putative ABC transport system permease protein